MPKPTSRVPHLLSIAEIAERLDVCDRTVRRIIEKKKLGKHRIGGQIRVSELDLAAYLAGARE